MKTDKDFNYYTYHVGRYISDNLNDENFKPYVSDTSKLVWNIFNEENDEMQVINVFEYNYVFLRDGLLYAKNHYADDFNKFADHIRRWLSHEYWSRCEYETIITPWPPYITKEELDRLKKEDPKYVATINLKVGYKLDVYTQIMMNWDRFIEYIWMNKKLITEKKLGIK